MKLWHDFKKQAQENAQQAFVDLLKAILHGRLPRRLLLNQPPVGKLYLHRENFRRDGYDPILFSSVPSPRFILPLAGEHRILQSRSSREKDIIAVPGDFYWVESNDWYLLRNDVERTVFTVVFRQHDVRLVAYRHNAGLDSKTQTHESYNYHTHARASQTIEHAQSLLRQAILKLKANGKDAGSTELEITSVRALLAWLLQDIEEKETVAPTSSTIRNRRFDQICAYITEHLPNKLDRESVAQEFRMSPDHLTRLFRQHSELGYVEFIAQKRFELAKHLLETSSLSVKEISVACGFNENAYFIQRFREQYGVTPAIWRKTSPAAPQA